MRRALLAVVAVALSPAFVGAQVRSFPYEAAIETDGVPVHSGPDGKFYETSRLKRGSRVIVHRHDPAGWYMISPPPGEFSLVKADEIRVTAPGAAEVVAEEVDVRVGSRTSPRHDAIQVPLTRGDRVQLAEGVQPPAGWVAIRPVRGEYRWIPGRYVVPIPETVRSQQDADPFAVPSVAKRPDEFDGVIPEAAPQKTAAAQGPTLTLGAPEAEAPGVPNTTEAMRLLDLELEGLALSEPTEWPLDELDAEYRRLRESNPSAGRLIDARLAQIGRMRMVKEHYGDYVRLTSATDQRDAKLMAKQGAAVIGLPTRQAARPTLAPPRTAGPTSAGPELSDGPPLRLANDPSERTTPLPPAAPPAESRPQIQGGPPYATTGITNRPKPRPPAPAAAPPAAPPAEFAGPVLMAPDAAMPDQLAAASAPGRPAPQGPPGAAGPAAAPPAGSGGAHRFDAVGIVQKAVDPHPEAPQFVLLAPNGRILVYLREQPGIPLEKFVGQPMGVDGEKHRHPELKTPMIVVDRLTPVRF